MFHLHDRTRRKLLLTGFVLICVLPTCAVAGWCLWRNSPWETRLAAERLQQRLGWTVKLERLRHPRPGTEVYENLELLDPETGRTIFTCRAVQVARGTMPDPQGNEIPALSLTLDQPEINAAAFPQIGRLLERALQDQIAAGENCNFSARTFKLRRGEAIETFSDIDAGVVHAGGDAQAAIRFQLPDAPAAAQVGIRLYRDRGLTPPQNHVEILTYGNEVPCDLLALGIPEFAKLGSKSRFQGELTIFNFEQENIVRDWEGKMSGKFVNVDERKVQATKLGRIGQR
jgi:hypothetical protein